PDPCAAGSHGACLHEQADCLQEKNHASDIPDKGRHQLEAAGGNKASLGSVNRVGQVAPACLAEDQSIDDP
ncbi:MAG: hypothetical protein QF637_04570, partial [Acidimicrobiales bacterium]|nr:hypothetical protein [Acidimicrobiales bacterium]